MIEDLQQQIEEATARANELRNQLRGTELHRAGLTEKYKAVLKDMLKRIEQSELEAAYNAGDKSVVRDDAAGSGKGGYVRRPIVTNEMIEELEAGFNRR